MRPALPLLLLLSLAACDAAVYDLRPEGERLSDLADVGFGRVDLGLADSGGSADAGGSDAGSPPDASSNPTVLGRGVFEGRAGHAGSGSVELVVDADGVLRVQLGADFRVSGVPGPIVVLSTRDALGSGLRPNEGDLRLGALARTSGAGTYPAPPEGSAARYVWVYCLPFTVEVARARLEAPR